MKTILIGVWAEEVGDNADRKIHQIAAEDLQKFAAGIQGDLKGPSILTWATGEPIDGDDQEALAKTAVKMLQQTFGGYDAQR